MIEVPLTMLVFMAGVLYFQHTMYRFSERKSIQSKSLVCSEVLENFQKDLELTKKRMDAFEAGQVLKTGFKL